MEEDDDFFARSMASWGVEPVGGRSRDRARTGDESPEEAGRSPDAAGDDSLEEADRRLFEQAMRDLGPGAGGGPAGRRPPPPRPRRLKTRPKRLRVDDQIDLHGLKGEPAMRRLGYFVEQASSSGLRTVLVITGKGHHSPGGRGVLKRRVEEWIVRRGRPRVRAWSEAPARLGGRGAFVLYLR